MLCVIMTVKVMRFFVSVNNSAMCVCVCVRNNFNVMQGVQEHRIQRICLLDDLEWEGRHADYKATCIFARTHAQAECNKGAHMHACMPEYIAWEGHKSCIMLLSTEKVGM
jgi:hypothetical protein